MEVSDEEWERLSRCSEDWQLVDDNSSCSSWAILTDIKRGGGSQSSTPLRIPSPSPVPGRSIGVPMLCGAQLRMRVHAATILFRLKNVGRKAIRRAERRKVTRRIERSFPEIKGTETDDYFFGLYRHVFCRIRAWEKCDPAPRSNDLAVRKNSHNVKLMKDHIGDDASMLPSFGFSSTSLEDVGAFYRAWESFVSERSFGECDKWLVTPGRDRATRRLMQRDNQKLRAAGRREYHGMVASLVRFVKARDPRAREIREIRQRTVFEDELRKIRRQEQKQAMREEAREAAWREERKWMKEASVLRAIRYAGVWDLPTVNESESQTKHGCATD
eukprot:CAMPEP_0167791490 /NCGR_PEP_ID=MMETSP0111_2-20121227/11974_1 /TAXON_ID=91324 /ORGANISM="Lotharella globosa, Strain CCCM811" /LENGTH=329 /DNA_ID=CAMNT_0007684183 /DNA_START=33 /DNA_END=1022 /DNA_ORIENTATION=-